MIDKKYNELLEVNYSAEKDYKKAWKAYKKVRSCSMSRDVEIKALELCTNKKLAAVDTWSVVRSYEIERKWDIAEGIFTFNI